MFDYFQMYCLVEFPHEDRDTATVPESWIFCENATTYCYWPKSFPSTKAKACTDHDPEKWEKHEVVVLRYNIGKFISVIVFSIKKYKVAV